ncbi:MAG: DUF3368 domain-containing protein [Schwartzia sp.]|nr:DUF3368 domain-containing protein [Schwartzia sp. (in: firmicutes)]
MRRAVVNSSPLIALSGLRRLDILQKLYGEVLIPDAVYREISAKQESVCRQSVDESRSWLRICPIENQLAKRFFKARLHDGEVEAMILAQERKADLLIMDDALAKKHAEYLGICVTGTLGVLIRARQTGIIEVLKPMICQLQENHIYISDALTEKCLKIVGE